MESQRIKQESLIAGDLKDLYKPTLGLFDDEHRDAGQFDLPDDDFLISRVLAASLQRAYLESSQAVLCLFLIGVPR